MIRLGIIGSGFGLYGLVPAFYPVKGCTITSVCAHNPERIRTYCTPRHITRIYRDWQTMLNKEQLDAVAIAVPPYVQYDIARTAIEKGLHVFAEKPLADTYKHAAELYTRAQKKGITHAVDFLFPEIPAWQKTKKLLDTETYGKLRSMNVNWEFQSFDIGHGITSWKTDIAKGGGAVSFYFSHTLHYLEYFAGPINDLQSSCIYSKNSPNDGETGAHLTLRFQRGVVGYAHCSCNTPNTFTHQLLFTCERATIILENAGSLADNFRLSVRTLQGTKMVSLPKPRSREDGRVLAVRSIASRFIAACKQRKPMLPSLEEGLRVQELIREIRGSHRPLTAFDRRGQ